MYDVDLDIYQGPMDLLLDLIKKNELDIYDIPIAFLTTEFIKEMNARTMDMNTLSSFLLMASTLLQIKSRMMLPKRKEDSDEDEEELDPRETLVKRLLEYQVYKEVAKDFKSREEEGMKALTRLPQEIISKEEAYLLQELETEDLFSCFTEIIIKYEDRTNEELRPIYSERFKVSDCIENLRFHLVERKRILFTDLLSESPSREELISNFLAVLELAKTGGCHISYKPKEVQIYIERREE